MKTFAHGVVLLAFLAPVAAPKEGMWTYHNPPRERLKEEYGFDATDEWLDHLRLSSVRFNDGGSASFVSPHGLVVTNHHVGVSSIQKVSTKTHDYVQDGMFAQTLTDELGVPDLELNVLVGMTDVTSGVRSAVPDGAGPEEAARLRREAINAIEAAARAKNPDRNVEVVTLYRGGEYWLYEYDRYTDVRLVFAPEGQVGYYGGDPDNFTFPRFNLDFSLFRVYRDGKPAHTPHYLRWNSDGVREGDLTFTSGHPGRTERLMTLKQVERIRDVERPRSLKTIDKLREALLEYGKRGAEEERQAKDTLLSYENARKLFTGQLRGLNDPSLLARKAEEERTLKEAVAAKPDVKAAVGNAWGEIADALGRLDRIDDQQYFSRLRGDLFTIAQQIVRYVEEREKPTGERLPEYLDTEAVERRITADRPLFAGLDEAILRASLELAQEGLAADDPFLTAALAGKSPAEVAHRVTHETNLTDPSVRRTLLEGGKEAVAKSIDPMILLARAVDPLLRSLRKAHEEISTELTLASGRIAEARFAVYGNAVYPDATFTLRLSCGEAKGYEENTTLVPWKTTFYGLYGRARSFDDESPFDLPARFYRNEARVDLSTPLNFVTTNDITGGNSGSPVVNRDGELIGLCFDGNVQSMPNDFVFGDGADRCVVVHAGGIIEALDKIYGARRLVEELIGVDR